MSLAITGFMLRMIAVSKDQDKSAVVRSLRWGSPMEISWLFPCSRRRNKERPQWFCGLYVQDVQSEKVLFITFSKNW